MGRLICDNIEHYSNELGFRLFGYCLMPDHLHVLLSPSRSGKSMDVWLQRFKSFTTNRYVKTGGRPPLWQRSAYDHVCRKGEAAEVVLRYIVENPIRKGLVETWPAWPWARVFIEL